MTDAESLDMLRVFAQHHGRCGAGSISTVVSEDDGSDRIRIVRQCERCGAQTTATITRGAAIALLREG